MKDVARIPLQCTRAAQTNCKTPSGGRFLSKCAMFPFASRVRPTQMSAAGVRSTFRIFRSVLATLHPCIDIPEAALPSGPAAGYPAAGEVSEEGESGSSSEEEGEGAAEGAAAGERHRGPPTHVVAGAAAVAAQGGPMGLLSLMTQTLVYKDQVGASRVRKTNQLLCGLVTWGGMGWNREGMRGAMASRCVVQGW